MKLYKNPQMNSYEKFLHKLSDLRKGEIIKTRGKEFTNYILACPNIFFFIVKKNRQNILWDKELYYIPL